MALRRAFFVWQFAAAAALPVWLLVGWALWGASTGGLLGVVLLLPLVVVVELALALVFSARPTVRRPRAADAPQMLAITAFQVGVVGFGCFTSASAWFGVLAVVAAIGGLWLAGRLLVDDIRGRVRAATAGFRTPAQPGSRRPLDVGEYLVLKPPVR